MERKGEPQRPLAGAVKEKRPKVVSQLCSDEDGDVKILGNGTDGFEGRWKISILERKREP